VAIVPRSTVELETGRGSLKLLEFIEGPFMRPLAIIYKRGRELSPAVAKFVEVLTSSKIPLPGQTGTNHERSERNHRDAKSPELVSR
jgi:hypothetical protein